MSFFDPQTLLEGPAVIAVLGSFAAGVFVSFTPCIYPVIPITVGYIGGQSGGSKLRGFRLSIVYVLGMALTYTVLGLVASLTGMMFGQIQSNPLTYIFVGGVCLLMGLAMLDVFALPQLPVPGSASKSGGFLMGMASGLVLGPCTAPVLGVLLGYVAARQNLVLGISMLLSYSLGIGTLLVILGTFTGLLTAMPKSGRWMVRIQKTFGWLMLIMAEYFIFNAGRLAI